MRSHKFINSLLYLIIQLLAKESRANGNNGGIRCFFVLFIDKRYISHVIHFKFTHNITEQSLPFLDIILKIENDTIATSIYYKDTEAHSFLNFKSSHPSKCKDSIPNSQLHRLHRIYSQDNDFKPKQPKWHPSSIKMNIQRRSLNKVNKVNSLTQDDALLPVDRKQTNNRIPFTLTYHPLNTRIKKIIYNNYHILNNDPHTKEIFHHAPPLMAFRRKKSIRDCLFRTNLRSADSPGTFPNNHHLCHTCNHVNSATTITNGSRSFTVKSKFTCSSSSIIYCSSCNNGETTRQLNNRLGEHMRNVKHKFT